MASYTFNVGGTTAGIVLVELVEELNGAEYLDLDIVNTAANRTLVGADRDVTITYNTVVIWRGKLVKARFQRGMLRCRCINSVYYKMKSKNITHTYTGADQASDILDDIATAAGITNASYTTPANPTPEVEFNKTNCWDALVWLANTTGSDFWATVSTDTINMDDNRGAAAVAKSVMEATWLTEDRSEKFDKVYVRGTIAGVVTYGSAGVGTNEVVFNDFFATEATELGTAATEYLARINKETSESRILLIVDDGYNLYPGDEVTLTSTEHGLSGDYEILRTKKVISRVELEIDRKGWRMGETLKELQGLERLGIYPIPASAVPKGAQPWNSDVKFSHGTDPHDDINWGAGTITFADGGTQAIVASTGVHTGLAVGAHYVYWTWGSTALSVSATYSDGVGPEKGIIARLTVPAAAADSMFIETVYSFGGSVGEGALGPEFDTPGTPAGWAAGSIAATAFLHNDGTVHSRFTIIVPAVSGATMYAVGWRQNGTTDYEVITSDSTNIVIEGLRAGTIYDVRAAAISKLGAYSAWTAAVNKTAAGDTNAPNAPVQNNIVIKNVSLILSWDKSTAADIDHYEVHGDINGAGYALLEYVYATTWTWFAAAGQLDILQKFKIKAVDHTGNTSGFSNEKTATAIHIDAVDLAIEQREWKSNLNFIWDEGPPPDWDEIWWGVKGNEKTIDAVVEFSDGTSNPIEFSTKDFGAATGDGTYVYYWDVTQINGAGDYQLVRDTFANYSNAVGAGKGLVAIVIINNAGGEPPTFYLFNSYAPLISTGILAAYAVLSKNITGASIYGKDIGTVVSVGETAAGIRVIGDAADIVGTAIGDAIGGNFTAGIWGFAAGPNRTFFFDPATGVINVYGTGKFNLRKSDGTVVGSLDMTVEGGRDVIKVLTAGAARDIILESGGYVLKVRGDGDFDVLNAAVLDVGTTSSRMVLPQFNGADPDDGGGSPRNGEIWIRTDL